MKKNILLCLLPVFLFATTTLTVNVTGDSNISASPGGTFSGSSGDLRGVLNHINLNPGDYAVVFAPAISHITLGAMLPLLNFPFTTNNALTIGNSSGPSVLIDGNHLYRGFFVASGTGPGGALTQVTLQNMVIQNVTSVGGSGGGGGMGAGAALFVDSAAVTLSNVTINHATVIGGAGGNGLSVGGGGLGAGSTGSTATGAASGGAGLGGNANATNDNIPLSSGGGGGGINCGTNHTGLGANNVFGSLTMAFPGNPGSPGGGVGTLPVGTTAAGDGGQSNPPSLSPGVGGVSGGGGGSGATKNQATQQGGGGGGGISGSSASGVNGGQGGYGGGGGAGGSSEFHTGASGDGGFGGGGGGGPFNLPGGNGGFGGGGGTAGAAVNNAKSNGGFGGGGAGYSNFPGVGRGGVGGGKGSSTNGGTPCGGGAGFGGAIFVRNGSFKINGPFSTDGTNSALGGTSGGGNAAQGWQAGDDCFFVSTVSSIQFDPQTGNITMDGSIGDDGPPSFTSAPSGVTLGTAVPGAAIIIGSLGGTGTVTFSGANTYSGGTQINGGILVANNNSALGGLPNPGASVASGATLRLGNGISIPSTQALSLTGSGLGGTGALTQSANGSSSYLGPITLNGAVTINTNGSGTLTLSGLLQGAGGSILSTGAGVLAISHASNTYSGGTTIVGGTISVSATGALGTGPVTIDDSHVLQGTAILTLANQINLVSGSIIDVTTSQTMTLSGVIQGVGGSLTKTGAGTLTLSGTSNYSGPTSVNAGILQAGANNAFSPNSAVTLPNTAGVTLDLNGFLETIPSLSGGGNLGGNVTLGAGTLTTGSGGSTTYSGSISGTGSLIKTGATTFTLTAASSYGGGTSITAGTISVSATGALGTGPISIGSSDTLQGSAILTLSNQVNLVSGSIIDVTTSQTMTLSGVIQGVGGSLTKTGAGTLTLSGTSTYNGPTTVNAGILQAGANNAFSPNSAVTLPNTAGVTLDVNGFLETIASLSGGGNLGGNVTLGAGTLTTGSGGSTTYSGSISGTGSLIKAGATTFTLTSVNSYGGGTIVNSGTLALFGSGELSPNGNVILNNLGNPGIFDISQISAGSTTIGNLSGVDGSFVNLGSKTLLVGTSITGPIFAGVIEDGGIGSGTGGSLTKQNGGTLTLSGANTYSGATTVNGGILRADAFNTFSPNSAVTLANAAGVSLDLNNFSQEISSLSGGGNLGGNVTLGAGALTTGSGGSTTYSGSISGTGSLVKTGATTFTLTSVNSYDGGTSIDSGTLALFGSGELSSNGNVILNNLGNPGIFDISQISAGSTTIGNLSGVDGSFVNLGSKTLFVGTSITSPVYAGVIEDGGIGGGTGGSLTKQNGGTLSLSGANTYTGATTVNGGTLQADAVNTFSPNSAVTLANIAGAILDLNNFSQEIPSLSGGGNLGGNVTLGAGTLTTGSGGSTTYSGSISGTGGVTKTGATIFTLDNTNSYSGTTLINTGTLQAGAPNVFSPNSAVSIALGATLNLNNFSQEIASLSGAGDVTLGAGTLTTGSGGSTTYAGSITGSGELKKVGATTFQLTGTNSPSTTDIVAGNLAVNGPLTSTVTVETNGTLSGNSIIIGNVDNFGTISPGNSIDTLTIMGDYTQEPGSTYLVEVSPSGSDLLIVTRTVTIDSNTTLHIDPSPGTYAASASYLILSSNGLTGAYTNTPDDLPTVQFTVDYIGNDIFLDLRVSGFTSVSCGGNIGKVAQYLDTLSPAMESDLTNVIHVLRSITNMDALNQALAQLQPASYKNLILAQEENVFTISRGISDHLNIQIERNCREEVDRKKQYELWGSLFGDWASLNNRPSSHCAADELFGYGAKGGGAFFGADYYFTDHCMLGAVGAYSYSYVHVNESRVKGHINTVYGALYAMLHQNHLFLDMAFIGGYDRFNASRKIQFAAVGVGSIHRTAYTRHGGWNIDGHLDGGYIIEHRNGMEIRPFLALDCLFLHENKFTESGADSLDLHVQASNNLLLRSEGGIHFSRCFLVSYGSWTPNLRASAVWEAFNSDGKYYRSNFLDQPGSFVVENRNPNRVLFSPGVGVSGVFYEDQMTMLVDYFGEYGYGYNNQVIKAEFAWAF